MVYNLSKPLAYKMFASEAIVVLGLPVNTALPVDC